MLADLFERVRSTATGGRDPEAEAFISEAVRAQPYAPYVLAQTTLVQQHALEAAAQRIAELESRAAAPAAPPQETSFLGNLGKTLFGGASPAPAPRSGYDASAYQRAASGPAVGAPQPAYAPAPQAGPWGAPPPAPPAGGGFLANAMTTAAGVAGGMMLANTLESLIGGRGGLFGGHAASGFGGFGGETINNFYQSAPDPAGQHAQDVLQDQDQDQDDAQDAQDAGYDGGSDASGFDSGGFDA
jgi:hypothetical protein